MDHRVLGVLGVRDARLHVVEIVQLDVLGVRDVLDVDLDVLADVNLGVLELVVLDAQDAEDVLHLVELHAAVLALGHVLHVLGVLHHVMVLAKAIVLLIVVDVKVALVLVHIDVNQGVKVVQDAVERVQLIAQEGVLAVALAVAQDVRVAPDAVLVVADAAEVARLHVMDAVLGAHIVVPGVQDVQEIVMEHVKVATIVVQDVVGHLVMLDAQVAMVAQIPAPDVEVLVVSHVQVYVVDAAMVVPDVLESAQEVVQRHVPHHVLGVLDVLHRVQHRVLDVLDVRHVLADVKDVLGAE